MTILDIAKECSRLLQITVPTAFVASTSNNQILLKAMIYKTIQEIRDEYDWPELTKQHLFKTINGLANYPLPTDYDRKINQTLWNRDQNWPLIGPIDPELWQQFKSGFITTLPMQHYRVKGVDNNQFFIDPTPTESDNDQQLVYEYISTNAIRPKTWLPNTAYTTVAPDYVFWNGQILKCIGNGTSSTTRGPYYGEDYTVKWDTLPEYSQTQIYNKGYKVYYNGNVYEVTTAGVSSAGFPTVTSGSETLGTAVFEFKSTPSLWAAGTEYAEGDYVIQSGGNMMQCSEAGLSGKVEPSFTDTYPGVNGAMYTPYKERKRLSDGTASWEVVDTYASFLADTDEIVLNNDMIIEGAVWRFLQAQRQAYDDLKARAEEKVESCKTKLQGLTVLSVSGKSFYPYALGVANYPPGNWGND